MIDLEDNFNMTGDREVSDELERMIGIMINQSKELLKLLVLTFLDVSDVTVGHATK